MNDIPEYMNPSAAIELYKANQMADRAAEQLRDAAKKGQVQREAEKPYRTYICPQSPNGKFLVQRGRTVTVPYQTAALGLQPTVSREGDVWVKFSAGVCVVQEEDPDYAVKCAWLDAHSGDADAHVAYHTAQGENPRACGTPIELCHESGPGVDIWAELKSQQLPTARREAVIASDLDIYGLLHGKYAAQQKTLKDGAGSQMAAAAEASEAAAKERAAGNPNTPVT